jgi:hypothetical protein
LKAGSYSGHSFFALSAADEPIFGIATFNRDITLPDDTVFHGAATFNQNADLGTATFNGAASFKAALKPSADKTLTFAVASDIHTLDLSELAATTKIENSAALTVSSSLLTAANVTLAKEGTGDLNLPGFALKSNLTITNPENSKVTVTGGLATNDKTFTKGGDGGLVLAGGAVAKGGEIILSAGTITLPANRNLEITGIGGTLRAGDLALSAGTYSGHADFLLNTNAYTLGAAAITAAANLPDHTTFKGPVTFNADATLNNVTFEDAVTFAASLKPAAGKTVTFKGITGIKNLELATGTATIANTGAVTVSEFNPAAVTLVKTGNGSFRLPGFTLIQDLTIENPVDTTVTITGGLEVTFDKTFTKAGAGTLVLAGGAVLGAGNTGNVVSIDDGTLILPAGKSISVGANGSFGSAASGATLLKGGVFTAANNKVMLANANGKLVVAGDSVNLDSVLTLTDGAEIEVAAAEEGLALFNIVVDIQDATTKILLPRGVENVLSLDNSRITTIDGPGTAELHDSYFTGDTVISVTEDSPAGELEYIGVENSATALGVAGSYPNAAMELKAGLTGLKP